MDFAKFLKTPFFNGTHPVAASLSYVKFLKPYTLFDIDLNPPKLYKTPASEDIIEGNSIVLMCEVDGSRPISYKWFKNGNMLKGKKHKQATTLLKMENFLFRSSNPPEVFLKKSCS